jgi:inward rectifier potassium channel
MADSWSGDQIEVVGAGNPGLRDLYHFLIRAPWPVTLTLIAGAWLAMNLLAAVAYLVIGGVNGAHGFADLFFFSVETSGTIGYGEMTPATTGAHLVMTVESVFSILLVALSTGLVFAKFSIPRARIRFARSPAISPYDGTPTLHFRLGHERATRLLEVQLRVVMIRTERTKEGVTMYRMYDLKLERDRSPAVSRSWTALHQLTEASPLWGYDAARMEKDEVEILLTLQGIDEVSAQMHSAQHYYIAKDVRWGVRPADLLSELPDGRLRMDMSKFDEVVPA